MDIGKSIRVALAERDKKASWLADELGIERQNITRIIKTGKASTGTMEKIANALEINLSELIALGEKK